MAKVTIIGAGSVEFTRGILADLCAYEELHGTLEIALHDIDAERIAYALLAADQLVERSDAGYRVSAHESRASAFDGADYLINEIQVGGYPATRTDFDVPKTFGLRQTIGDTIGIGGIMRGLRTIPVMIEMADEMVERCPDGLLLNYTNPMAMVPWGIWSGSRLPPANVVGVCHSVRDTHAFLARTVGVPEERVEFRTAGFNHQCFVYVFRDRETGEDLYPRLRAIVEADPEGLGRRVRVELFRRFGYFPTESSEHSAEYVPWFLHHDDLIDRYRIRYRFADLAPVDPSWRLRPAHGHVQSCEPPVVSTGVGVGRSSVKDGGVETWTTTTRRPGPVRATPQRHRRSDHRPAVR